MHTPMLGGETRRVFLSGRHEVLPRPLRHHDDHILLPLEHVVHVLADVLHRHLDLRDQAEVHQVRSERRVSRDEAGIAPHQLDDANALLARGGLDPAVADHLRRRLHRRVEAKGAVDKQDVVVDRLWHADNRDGQPLPPRLLVEQVACELGPVAADHKEQVDAELLEGLADLWRVEAASPRLEDRSALHVDLADNLRVELEHLVLVWRGEAVVPARGAVDLPHVVVVPQAVGDALDDRVEAGAQASARHHDRLDLGGLPENVLGRVGADAVASQGVAPDARL
mmetsp:Transcript_22688/g.73157  ORF Transcript_22688/g.73157 Transcript_22688/m.73157 type:complete len:282 (-) Transcript_22688:278-1123(-)